MEDFDDTPLAPAALGAADADDTLLSLLKRGAQAREVVMMAGTEAFNRGEKWARYQTWLPELTD